MKFVAALTVAMAALSNAAPVAEPEPNSLVARYSAWAFYVSSGAKCNSVIFSDAGTSSKGCTNLGSKVGGSVNFVGASTGKSPVGTFYSEAGCQGAVVSANSDSSCIASTIKSYKIVV